MWDWFCWESASEGVRRCFCRYVAERERGKSGREDDGEDLSYEWFRVTEGLALFEVAGDRGVGGV